MQVKHYLCNICQRQILVSGHDYRPFAIGLKLSESPKEAAGLTQCDSKDADIHICNDCLIHLRVFLDSGLIANMFGEQVALPSPCEPLPGF